MVQRLDARLRAASPPNSMACNKPVYRVTGIEGLPQHTYIFHCQPSARILTSQGVAGRELQRHCIDASEEFLRVAYPYCLQGQRVGDICEIVIMSGGNFYGMKTAFERVYQHSLPQAYMGVSRFKVKGEGEEMAEFDAELRYENFESVPTNMVGIVGETIATGTTMKKSILRLNAWMSDMMRKEQKYYNLNSLAVFTLCGAIDGGRVLGEIERKIQEESPEFRLFLFASEALFGLQNNGTDMPFYHNDTIVCPEMQQVLDDHPGVAHLMKCGVFDWGNRCKNPEGAYDEFIEYCIGVEQLWELRRILPTGPPHDLFRILGPEEYPKLMKRLGAEHDWEVGVLATQICRIRNSVPSAIEEIKELKQKAMLDKKRMDAIL